VDNPKADFRRHGCYYAAMQFADIDLWIVEYLRFCMHITKKPPAEAGGKASLKETGI
jgi:hypothetical protein